MQGDFTRWTYDSRHSYRSVLMQQGRVLLDAEWNEQAGIAAHHDEARTRDIVGRSGGPLPVGGAPGGFAIVKGTDGSIPKGVTWAGLAVTPGTYYVNGILAEAWPNPDGAAGIHAWPLADQPYLATVGSGAGAEPGLPEPPKTEGDGRYAIFLDVWSHHVSADERVELLESALGGPDTTTREQTVWQVRVQRITDADVCSTMSIPGWLERAPRLMAPSLRAADEDADPCRITAAGGYQRLENQLYRVQIHDGGPGAPTFLWSRENASVTARLLAINDTSIINMDDELTLDRVGRDEELSIRAGDLVEVTSRDRELRQLPGFLAKAGPTNDARLAVKWTGTAPGFDSLGAAPIVRRWEGGPLELSTTGTHLEGGIVVTFPTGGTPATGDYWMIPARTVRLAYGVSTVGGTLEWPQKSPHTPLELPPQGPVHHLTPLAELARSGKLWTRESDCRRLFPPLTDLLTLDLVGGDGQEAMPGDWLPQPVRVVVRNGGLPVAGAAVRFTAPDGDLDPAEPPVGTGSPSTVLTGSDGVASMRWRLDPAGATTQTLRVQRLDDVAAGIDVEVVATARLSVARQVAWDPPCEGFDAAKTVQDALAQLVETADLRLLGGDGQHATVRGRVLPQYIRVMLDSPCGPVAGAKIVAKTGDKGLLAEGREGEPLPPTLSGTGAAQGIEVVTGADGVARFAWQPGFSGSDSDLLTVVAGGSNDAPVQVTAQLITASARTPGVHIKGLRFGSGVEFENDSDVSVANLASGIIVDLDGAVIQKSVQGKPVARVVLDLPWPMDTDGQVWGTQPIGYRRVELLAELNADGAIIVWTPLEQTVAWFKERLWLVIRKFGWKVPLVGRFILDGWAIVSEEDRALHLNGHVNTELDDSGRTVLRLPTDDEVAGGQFEMWFRLRAGG